MKSFKITLNYVYIVSQVSLITYALSFALLQI